MLQDGLKTEAEKAEALESIRASGTTLLQLVNDVLDLAKMDAGKMALRLVPVQLDSLTGEVFDSFRLAASKKGIELVNRTAGVPTVMLDSHRFRQIL
ncbi:MAG: HAMP domain-containing histidine kinase, partial [Lentisphaeria bacterium]|nr:HAMP domain-containing histidine kinase [Lentisphaeria bacterium]